MVIIEANPLFHGLHLALCQSTNVMGDVLTETAGGEGT